MTRVRVGTDRTATEVFIADWHREGHHSALDVALNAIVATGQPVHARYAGRGTSDSEGAAFTITTELAARLVAATSTAERVRLLGEALVSCNEASEAPLAPFDADGNAARILNVISRLAASTIRSASSEHQIMIRLHAENNGVSSRGDVVWSGSDSFAGDRVPLRADHSRLVHRRPTPSRPSSTGVSVAGAAAAERAELLRQARIARLVDRMQALVERVPDTSDVPVRAARIAGTLEGYLINLRSGNVTAGRPATAEQLAQFEAAVPRLSAELTELGC